jgi:hypothetical protein
LNQRLCLNRTLSRDTVRLNCTLWIKVTCFEGGGHRESSTIGLWNSRNQTFNIVLAISRNLYSDDDAATLLGNFYDEIAMSTQLWHTIAIMHTLGPQALSLKYDNVTTASTREESEMLHPLPIGFAQALGSMDLGINSVR